MNQIEDRTNKGPGCIAILLAFLALCGKGLKSCGPIAEESAKATEEIRSSEGHYGWIYGVRAVWQKYKDQKYKDNKEEVLRKYMDNKAEKNERGAIERDSVESSLIGETPLYPGNIRKGKMKRNMAPIIGGWKATINEGDSIRVVNLNIVSEHTIYSTGLTGKGKLRETWMSSDGKRYTYYDGNEKINVEVLSISWDTLCAFLSVGDEIAVIPFLRRKV